MSASTRPLPGAGEPGLADGPDQMPIPSLIMRGGTSRGPFFLGSDLPEDTEQRNRVLLAAMGSAHPLQIDGIGGAHPLTSKAGIVSLSARQDVDLEFTFAQLQPGENTVQTTANCGNMLAAVVPFALERGLFRATADTTTAVVLTTNTGLKSRITVQTPLRGGTRKFSYAGKTEIAGVPGTGSAIQIGFLDTAGSIAGVLLPTGSARDTFELADGSALTVTCLDNGQPMVVMRAEDLGLSGNEAVARLDADTELKRLVEEVRIAAGAKMGLGDVAELSYPKMTIVSPPGQGGDICTRSLIPHAVHTSIGVLAAVTVATAAALEESVASDYISQEPGRYRIEHPSGCFEVSYTDSGNGPEEFGIIRTARLIMRGEIEIPARAFGRPRGEQRQGPQAHQPQSGKA